MNLVWQLPMNEEGLLDCLILELTGFECPGCGSQRSFWALMEGNITESIMLFPALLPILSMLGYLFAHIIFKFKNGASVLKYSFIFNASLIIGTYILKLLI